MHTGTELELKAFIDEWPETPDSNREVFQHLLDYLSRMEEISFEFIPRPGVTYSLRAAHTNQEKRGLFVMVDVIEDEPRWLSVCFYGDMISDPDEMGDFVPEGLLGEDAVCFDIEERDESLVRYIETRMDEACRSAAKG